MPPGLFERALNLMRRVLLGYKNSDDKIACQAFISVSRHMKNQLLELGASISKLKYIPCGVDTKEFSGSKPFKDDLQTLEEYFLLETLVTR